MVRFCTIFDSRYLTRGLAMISSLRPFLREADEVIVLAMDDVTEQAIRDRSQTRVIRVGSLEDTELLALQKTRAAREFCWTCTPALVHWMVRNSSDGEIVVYLDADLLFFGDPRILLDELAGDGNILIHEHRYSPDKAHFEKISGRFNVGLVAFRVGEESRTCVDRWRAQTLEKCEIDLANCCCGDQGYLDEWPSLYPGLRILGNIGGGVAPWNVNQYQVGKNGHGPTVDGCPVVFYHYHALETLAVPKSKFAAINPARDYRFSRNTKDIFYEPYAREIKRVESDLIGKGHEIASDRTCHGIGLMVGLALGRYVRAN